MATLYRKYRPQNFREVVGQNHIKITLQNEIQANKIAHAYLFCGPRAVGKTTLARVVSKAINCLKRKDGDFEPCNKCEICEEINNSRSLDIMEIDAASHTGVDNVRENIIASARVVPVRCKYKVFIIDEVHMLSISAFNALLKIIEEPPEFVIFILCTTEVHKVPTTIISRCQRFDFKRINVIEIVKKLDYIVNKEGIKVNRKILEEIARQSEGHMRDAESLLGQVVSISGKEITDEEANLVIARSDLNEVINLIDILVKKDSAKGITLINKLVDDGADLKNFLNYLIEILRKILLNKINPGLSEKLGLELGESIEVKISEVSKDLSVEQVIVMIEKFIEIKNKVKESFITQLPVEIAITELCLLKKHPSIKEPAGQISNIKSQNSFINAPAVNQAPVPAQPVNKISSSENLDKNEIIERWQEVLSRVKVYNHSLSFILRACEPRDLNGNQLCLAFKYKFHKDRVSDMEIKSMIEKVLNEVYNKPLIIQAIIDESLILNNGSNNIKNKEVNSPATPAKDLINKEKTEEASGMVDNLLKNFGGKIIK
ncbi:MAG: DNA polymerase III subunit gamma/tau [Patescibacteria group bacterium]